MFTRRQALFAAGYMAAAASFATRARAEGVPFAEVLDILAASGGLEGAGGSEEFKELLASKLLDRGFSRSRRSSRKIHAEAVDLIVFCEVTSQTVYERRYQGAIWPKKQSGVTVGIGYDVGYVTAQELIADWKDYISRDYIENLRPACGLKGIKARDILPTLKPVKITFSTARKQFEEKALPEYIGVTEAKLPNCQKLSSRCLGALTSLTYNRGGSYTISEAKDPNGRYTEMRMIRKHMSDQHFERIPAEILSMQRLWQNDPDASGVVIRRRLEAELFRSGLS